MDCHRFEDRFEAFLAAELPAGERAACEEHLARCPACRELLELARSSLSVAGEAGDLAGPVLARTSGSPCGRAGELLASRLDAGGDLALDPLTRELLDLHLTGCDDCRSLAAVLAAVARDLPGLADVRPDPGFVDDVLARTLPARVRWRRVLARAWSRRWATWVRRPRFAWEAAFVCTLAFLPVLTSSAAPLVEAAREMAEEDRVQEIESRFGRIVDDGRRTLLGLEPVAATGRTVTAARESLEELPSRAETWVEARLEAWGTLRAGLASFLVKAADGEVGTERPEAKNDTDLTDPTDTRAGDGSKGDPK